MGNNSSSNDSPIDESISPSIDQEHISKLKSFFHKAHPNGFLTKAEFLRENMQLHPNTNEEFWETLFHALDRDDSGALDLREYLIAYSIVSRMNIKDERLKFWFQLIDQDSSGKLTLDECEFLFATLIEMSDLLKNDSSNEITTSSDDEISEVTQYSFSESRLEDSEHFLGKRTKSKEINNDKSSPDILQETTTIEVNLRNDGDTDEDAILSEKSSSVDEQIVSNLIIEIFNRMDANGDGYVTFNEFQNAVENDEILRRLLFVEISVDKLSHLHQSAYVQPQNFKMQVAGHGSERVTKPKKSFLKIKSNKKEGIKKIDNNIWKPLDNTEYEFYEYLYHPSRESDPIISKLKEFVPKYFGRSFIEFNEKQIVYYIVLEDLLLNFNKIPCVADLKIGNRGYDSKAGLKKRVQQIGFCKLSTSRTLGFRFCGYKSFDIVKNEERSLTKRDGGLLSTSGVEQHLRLFIDNGKIKRYDVYEKVLIKLEEIQDWFKNQKRFQFYSSSLLIAYDGASKDSEVVVRMVDFAHTDIDEKEKIFDKSYLFGLKKLIKLLKEIVKEKNLNVS